ncbi:hypothetical protein [Mycobacterium sp. M26]|uniref:hypothetical protein n=1 Tax=Mycobacterium sp. M26 TaxID=1762962 RepID=UPI000A79F90E|nr:hypothetical protein [Mycobacterium sp. M26]
MTRTTTSLLAALGGMAACSLILAGPAAAAGHGGPGEPGPGVGTHIGVEGPSSTQAIGYELPLAPIGVAGPGEAAPSAATHLTSGGELPFGPIG